MDNEIKAGETAKNNEILKVLMANHLIRLSKEAETAQDGALIGLSSAMVSVYNAVVRD